MGNIGDYYSRTVWTQEEIDTWDDAEPATSEPVKPTLTLVVNRGRTPE